MSKRDAEDQRMLWLSRPLCRRYIAGNFSKVFTPVRGSNGAQGRAVQWVVGCLRDGDCELLGAWIPTEKGPALWAEVFADLEIRGVESIKFVFGNDLANDGEGQRVAPFGATELPSIEQTLAIALAQVAPRHRDAAERALRTVAVAGSSEAAGEALRAFERDRWGERYPQIVAQWRLTLAQWAPLFALPASLRRVVVSGDRAAADLHRSLVRAIDRHGCFANQTAALDFVADSLLRAERRLDRARAVAVSEPRIHRLGTGGRRPASAPGAWDPR
ncbi:MAG: transposase [Paucibacter sp.]|nr:transposase [Roseateles sp.]